MHGGMKIYRGSPAAARNYVEADRSRADDYYLAEGTGLAHLYVATSVNSSSGRELRSAGTLTGDGYEAWVSGMDRAGAPKGRLRTDAQGVRFVEVVVNGPKTWSLAASLRPEIAAAYDAAQQRAATEIIRWVAENATTRVGPRGRQVQVPVKEIEAAVIRHYTSRSGDPHRHLHLQINARVWAHGGWRGIHTVGIRDSLEAINGIGHAAVMCDPEFRQALARYGYHLDPESGEVIELSAYVGAFSARAAQIGRNIDRYEAAWRAENPGDEPGPRLRQTWDTRAWAEARPDKVVPRDGTQLAKHWAEEIHALGFRPPARGTNLDPLQLGRLNRQTVVDLALTRLGSRRSAWNAADIRGEVEQIIALTGIVVDAPIRTELAEDLTCRTLESCVPLLDRTDVPSHVRRLTSHHVLAVENDIIRRFTARVRDPGRSGRYRLANLGHSAEQLDAGQRAVVAAMAGPARLLVIEGAAGSGKTTALAAARAELDAQGRRLLVVTPTLRAAAVAARQVGTAASSAAWLAHQYGFRWDIDGRWTRTEPTTLPNAPTACLQPGDVLLVDEAGMLDQDTARALLTIADETGANVTLLGDRHQLPAVGRGGVLDLASRAAGPFERLTLDTVHRFTDPTYADLTKRMRTGERCGETFDMLLSRGQIVVHATEVERAQALIAVGTGADRPLIVASTREQVASLNAAIRDHRLASGSVRPGAVATAAGEQIGVGDRVATRRNDPDLGVANRDTWTVLAIRDDCGLVVGERSGERSCERGGELTLPPEYVRANVELAYACTVHGAQGETVRSSHILVGEQTGAAGAYVGMTRGRDRNVAHLVAESVDDARRQWVDVFDRDRADLGPRHATALAIQDIDRYGIQPAPRIGDIGSLSADPRVVLQAAALRAERAGPRQRPDEPHRPASSPGQEIGL